MIIIAPSWEQEQGKIHHFKKKKGQGNMHVMVPKWYGDYFAKDLNGIIVIFAIISNKLEDP